MRGRELSRPLSAVGKGVLAPGVGTGRATATALGRVLMRANPWLRWLDALRLALRLIRLLQGMDPPHAAWPTLWGGGWTQIARCRLIGQYPPNWWWRSLYNTDPFGHAIHGSVGNCLAGQGDTQNDPPVSGDTLAVESYRYRAWSTYNHRLVRSWARPVSRRFEATVKNEPARVVVPSPVLQWESGHALPLVVRPAVAPLAPNPLVRPTAGATVVAPSSIEVDLGRVRLPRRAEEVVVAPGPRPAPNPRPEPWSPPVLGPKPVDEVVLGPGGAVHREARAYDRVPPRGVRERKAGLTHKGLRLLIRAGVNPFTEFLDVVDALHDALPEKYQSRSGGASGRIEAVWRYFRMIDVEKALEGLVKNAIEDVVFGRLSGRAADHARVRPQVAIGWGAGPAL